MTGAGTQGDGTFDAAGWFSLLHRVAEVHVARCDLDGFGGDIAQEAFALLWERRQADGLDFRANEAERLVRRLAEAERHARGAERRHVALVRHDAPRPGPPEPCPEVARLGPAHPHPSAFRTRLRATAHTVARVRGVLRDGQFRLFDLVWIAGAAPNATAGHLGVSDRAARERLRRASDRIEERIIDDLRAAMPASRWEAMRLFLAEKCGPAPARAVAEAVFAGLGRVIHTHALSLGIE